MRLHKAEDAHKLIESIGSNKLRDLITDNNDVVPTQGDTDGGTTSSDKSLPEVSGSNVACTLD